MEELVGAVEPYFSSWLELATTPYGSQLDATKMFWPVALPRKSHFKAAAKMRAVKLENDIDQNLSAYVAETGTSQEKNGDVSTSPARIVVGTDVDMSVTQTRVVTASALGILASKLYVTSLGFVIDPLWKALNSSSGVQRQVQIMILDEILATSFQFVFLPPFQGRGTMYAFLMIVIEYQVASMMLISWFKELNLKDLSLSGGVMFDVSNNFRSWLLELLACANPAFPTKDSCLPYAELSRTYGKMRNEASQLHRTAEASGMFQDLLSSMKMDLENLTADDALTFASKFPSLINDSSSQESSERNMFDELESQKQRLLTTSGYLKCVQVCKKMWLREQLKS